MGDTILIVAHLLNHMQYNVLQFQTPFQSFLKSFSIALIVFNLPLKIFGCTTFIHEHKYLGKLEFHAIKCVFIGYSYTKKRL